MNELENHILEKSGWKSPAKLIRWCEVDDVALALIKVSSAGTDWYWSVWLKTTEGWEECSGGGMSGDGSGPAESSGANFGIVYSTGTEYTANHVQIHYDGEVKDVPVGSDHIWLFVAPGEVDEASGLPERVAFTGPPDGSR